MKLEDFISESISQIINGVKNAQKHAEENNAKVNPVSLKQITSFSNSYIDEYTHRHAQVIEFDISVTTKEQGSTSGKAGVFVTVFGAGIEAKEGSENFTSNRIKFDVPIILPTQKNE